MKGPLHFTNEDSEDQDVGEAGLPAYFQEGQRRAAPEPQTQEK
jgi:hypothetical protein